MESLDIAEKGWRFLVASARFVEMQASLHRDDPSLKDTLDIIAGELRDAAKEIGDDLAGIGYPQPRAKVVNLTKPQEGP